MIWFLFQLILRVYSAVPILFFDWKFFIGSRDKTAILWNLSGFVDGGDEGEVAPLEILLGHEVCDCTHPCNGCL